MVKFTPDKNKSYTKEEKEYMREGRKLALMGTLFIIFVLISLYILERIR
jgi:hypothetical protein